LKIDSDASGTTVHFSVPLAKTGSREIGSQEVRRPEIGMKTG
jgi:hypothetical protein